MLSLKVVTRSQIQDPRRNMCEISLGLTSVCLAHAEQAEAGLLRIETRHEAIVKTALHLSVARTKDNPKLALDVIQKKTW